MLIDFKKRSKIGVDVKSAPIFIPLHNIKFYTISAPL